MLPGGAHIKVGDYEYMLDRSKPEPYKRSKETLFAQTTAIAGEIAKQQLRPEKILWYNTDWSGGEGAKIYYPQAPTLYDKASLMNVQNKGLLTTRPKRRRASVARSGSNATTAMRPAGGAAWNKALIGWGDNVLYSSDGITWSATTHGVTSTGYSFFDADSDGRYLVLGSIAEGTTANILLSLDGSPTTPTGTDIYSGTTANNPPSVAEIIEGVPYVWTINASGVLALMKGGTTGAANAFSTSIYASGFVPSGLWGTDYWTDIEAAESSLYMSLGTPSGSVVFESRQDVGRVFWTGPQGFTIKKLVYHAGVLFCLGSQTAAGKRFAAVWAIPLSTRSPIFIAAPRRHRNEELYEWTIGCPGYGNTIFLADANSGKIFQYDIQAEALSLFDDLANGGTGDGTTFAPGEGGNLVPYNTSSFEGGTLGLSGWTAESGTPYVDPGSYAAPRTGLYHLALLYNGATHMAVTATGTSGVSVSPSTSYTYSFYAKQTNGGTATISFKIRWYDVTGVLISTDAGTSFTTEGSTYASHSVVASSPSTARYAAVDIGYVPLTGTPYFFIDDVFFGATSATTADKLAFLAMFGSRLFGATYSPLGSGTSLQIITWDDSLKENRDGAQAIVASLDSAEWDFGIPQELKALNGVYVTYEITDPTTPSGLVAESQITISYAADAGIFSDTFTDLDTITSETVVANQGRYFIPVSDGEDTVTFTRLKTRIALDNNGSSSVAPPMVYSYVPEAQLMAYSEVWDLIVRVQDEQDNERPSDRQMKAWELRDNLDALSTNKKYVTFLDGVRYPGVANGYSEHVVQVEDPQDSIEELDTGEGSMKIRLRSVPV